MKEFIEAVSEGDIDQVRNLLAAQPSLAVCRAESGETAIQRSVYWGKTEITDLLVRQNQELDLATACVVGDLAVVQRILAEDPAQANRLSGDGFLPLCLAVAFGHMPIARALLDTGADVNARSRALGGVAPIHSAVFGRNAEAVRLLLDRGADVDARQEGGFTALQGACQNGDVEMVADLLRHGARVDLKTDGGRKAIDYAREHHSARLLELLEESEKTTIDAAKMSEV